ncbi:MAG: DSD1 family PLP-dependent enzyme [Betaproteobacteria bacterium]|nr:DSD1 family PLP-dependent enzyme [Betaproteobacteria bacterium]MSQ88690.1 DSD1 family PLP-dependent enzyme [Betaproteobacteria bacterium]
MTVRAPAAVGMRLEDVDTPALILDLDAFETNLKRLAQAVPHRVRVRGHAKTHKCPEIGKRQIAAGAVGLCCQKVAEAEAMVEGGINDVLVSNEVVGAAKLERLAALARRAKLGVCVDHADQVRDLAAAMQRAGAHIDVYVELEVGMHRCGVAPGEPALALARAIQGSPSLRFAGLQAYHGRAQHLRLVAERRAAIRAAALSVQHTRAMLREAGLPCPTVTGAGSGTFMFEVELEAWDEIQPGSYVFMDADYARNEWAPPMPRFEHALFVLATVMSRPGPEAAILDAGLKASSVDSGMPGVWQRPGLAYTRASDEHGWLELAGGNNAGAQASAALPALGDKLLLVPGHCDPTVNLYDWYVCVRGGVVEALWPITARGALY